MTIADKLYNTDPDTLFTLVVIYQLRGIGKLYFPENVIDDDYEDRNTKSLMTPGDYHGKSERVRGAITQRHGLVIK